MSSQCAIVLHFVVELGHAVALGFFVGLIFDVWQICFAGTTPQHWRPLWRTKTCRHAGTLKRRLEKKQTTTDWAIHGRARPQPHISVPSYNSQQVERRSKREYLHHKQTTRAPLRLVEQISPGNGSMLEGLVKAVGCSWVAGYCLLDACYCLLDGSW